MSILKTPLTYPGGKSKMVDKLFPCIPYFKEYREPFVGGGSMFVYTRQRFPTHKFWINDAWDKLINFYQQCQVDIDKIYKDTIDIIEAHKDGDEQDGRDLFQQLNKICGDDESTPLDKATAFFLRNRMSFGARLTLGVTNWNNRNLYKYKVQTLGKSNIHRLLDLKDIIKGVKITCGDYSELLNVTGEDVFIFCDPPYPIKSDNLYGDNGELHKSFSHEMFAESVKNCNHKIMITYNDSEYIKGLYSELYIYPFELHYSMSSSCNKVGKELIITNYKIF